ncbi:MAG: hypothetical protein HC803_03015 [Saprospiraceae bacterium]|nr:hypothetical protein [Saprospiraceae bacterium]
MTSKVRRVVRMKIRTAFFFDFNLGYSWDVNFRVLSIGCFSCRHCEHSTVAKQADRE